MEERNGNNSTAQWTKLSQQAKQALETGDFEAAERRYRWLLNQVPHSDPQTPLVKSGLSEALSNLDRWTEADRLDHELMAAGKANQEGLEDIMNDVLCRRLIRGNEFYNRRHFWKALSIFNDALKVGNIVLPRGHPATESLAASWTIAQGQWQKQREKEALERQRTGLLPGREEVQPRRRQEMEHQGQKQGRLEENDKRSRELKEKPFITPPKTDTPQPFNITISPPHTGYTQTAAVPLAPSPSRHINSAHNTPLVTTATAPTATRSTGIGRSRSVDRGRPPNVSPSPTPETLQPSRGQQRPWGQHPSQRRPTSASRVHIHSNTYFDLRSYPAANDQVARTNRWFDVHLAKTQKLLSHFRRDKNGKRVRIAVLDTGFKRTNPDPKLQAITGDNNSRHQRRIMDYRSWVPGLMGDEDTSGHGTDCAMTLNRVAPEAALYIARICKDGRGIDEAAVAEAIRHAVNQWQVDIISMSFGLDQVSFESPIKKEIKAASDAGVLMFAAASNDGKNVGRTYPARDEHVFCVYATDSDGALSSFNPYLGPERNYAILGEHVMAPWRRDEDPMLSGTSVATPIMAGVAALALEFVRQRRVEGQQEIRRAELLRTMGGMQKVLFEMKDDNEEVARAVLDAKYLYVTPWELLAVKGNEDEEEARKRIAFKINAALDKLD